MDKNKEFDSNKKLDDELSELLSSSSSAADALNALSYDKSSHSLVGAEEENPEPEVEELKTQKPSVQEPNAQQIDTEDVPEVQPDDQSEQPDVKADTFADEPIAEPKSELDDDFDDLNIVLGKEDETPAAPAPTQEDSEIAEIAEVVGALTAGNADSVDEIQETTVEAAEGSAAPAGESEDELEESLTDESLNESDDQPYFDEDIKIAGDKEETKVRSLADIKQAAEDSAAESKKDDAIASLAVTSSKPKKPASQKSGTKKKKKKGKKKSKVNNSIFTGIIITIIILTISTVIAFTGISVGLEFLGVGKSTSTIKLNIDESYDVDDVADVLYDKGIINSKLLFKICVGLKNAEGKIVAGDIELSPSMSYNTKINTLMSSRQTLETVDVTFPEGTTLYEAATLLKENGVINSLTDFIYDFNSLKLGYDYEDVIDSQGDKFFAMEGYFFPDTYQFYKDSDNETVIATLREAFDTKFTDEMMQRADELGYTLDEVLTLASIVQLESASVDEMPTVASVFLNRLNDGPENQYGEYIAKLQSDPTSNYYTDTIVPAAQELKNYTTDEITAFQDKYDTYEREGLPVGPICNPGLDAINAVLYPAETDYFYFCHDLNTKQAYFASTLSEHEANLVTAGLA